MQPLCYIVEDGSIGVAAIQRLSTEAEYLQHNGNEPLLQLRFSSSSSKYATVMESALQICRQHGELPKWNVLHISEADALRAMQLCIGERTKQECGEFCAQASDVLAVHQRLNNNAIFGDSSGIDGVCGDPDAVAYQRYLTSGRLVDGPAVVQALRRLQHVPGWRRPTVIHGRPASLLERTVAALLTGDEPIAVRQTTEVPVTEATETAGLDSRQTLQSETGEKRGRDVAEVREMGAEVEETTIEQEKGPLIESARAREWPLELVRTVWHCVDLQPAAEVTTSHTDDHIKNMLSAMFRLLVNSRDELALAAACQAPGLELTGADFLAIRRTARARALPMYQTVVSHVRRVELGGANYQPTADCHLHRCTRSLQSLVRLLHRLHDLLEEESDPSACCLRLLSVMKAVVSRGSRLRPSAVERVAAQLRHIVAEVAAETAAKPDPAVVGGPAVQLVRRFCDRLSCAAPPVTEPLRVLEDVSATPASPGRRPAMLPSVVSLFRTPPEVDEEESNDGCGVPLEERLRRKGIARPARMRTDETPTTTKRCGGSVDGSAGDEPTPPLVAGPTLVCSRSGTKYAPGEGVRAYRQLQTADLCHRQENKITSPKTSRAPKNPKRSLFNAIEPANINGCCPKRTASKIKNSATMPAVKRKKAEEAQDQENLDASRFERCQRLQQSKTWDVEKGNGAGSDDTKIAAEKKNAKIAQKHNLTVSDINRPKAGQQQKGQIEGQKRLKAKHIKQVDGQKSIRDFFRI